MKPPIVSMPHAASGLGLDWASSWRVAAIVGLAHQLLAEDPTAYETWLYCIYMHLWDGFQRFWRLKFERAGIRSLKQSIRVRSCMQNFVNSNPEMRIVIWIDVYESRIIPDWPWIFNVFAVPEARCQTSITSAHPGLAAIERAAWQESNLGVDESDWGLSAFVLWGSLRIFRVPQASSNEKKSHVWN